jgi:hypothetical protein
MGNCSTSLEARKTWVKGDKGERKEKVSGE